MDDERLRITEQIHPEAEGIDQWPTRRILEFMNREDARVVEAVGKVLGEVEQAVEAIAERLRGGGRLFYVGAGTSGRLGVLDASECPPTFGTDPEMVQAVIAGGYEAIFRAKEAAEDVEEAGAEDLRQRGLSAQDAVVGLSASGTTPYVLGALKYAKQAGALAVGVTCNPEAPMAEIVDIFIAPVVGPEVIAGSTRLKCGTAQKMILNMISTATMIRLGRVAGALMIDVRPTSQKLRERAVRIIRQLTGARAEEASRALEEAGWNVRRAVELLRGKGEAEAGCCGEQ